MLLCPKEWFLRNYNGWIIMPGQRPYKSYSRWQQPLLHRANLRRKSACPQKNTHPPVCPKLPFSLFSLLISSPPSSTPKDHVFTLSPTGPSTVTRMSRKIPFQNDSPILWSCVSSLQQGKVVAVFSLPIGNPKYLAVLGYSLLSSFKASAGRGYLGASPAPLHGS